MSPKLILNFIFIFSQSPQAPKCAHVVRTWDDCGGALSLAAVSLLNTRSSNIRSLGRDTRQQQQQQLRQLQRWPGEAAAAGIQGDVGGV